MKKTRPAPPPVWLIPTEAGQAGEFRRKVPADWLNLVKFLSMPSALKLLGGKNRPHLVILEGRPNKTAQQALAQLKDLQPSLPVFLINHWESAGLMQSWISQNFMELVRPNPPVDLEPTNTYRLSERELDILRLMVKGLIKKEIAEQLQISYHTVDNHERNIFKKMNIHTRSAAVAKALIEKIC